MTDLGAFEPPAERLRQCDGDTDPQRLTLPGIGGSAPPLRLSRSAVEKPRDEIWDALEAHFGPVRTPPERGRRNRAVSELRAGGATAEEVTVAVAWCCRTFTHFTEVAVCNNFSRALHETKKSTPAPLAAVLDLPELSEEERLANLERLKGMGL